jgi:hypothetical protein
MANYVVKMMLLEGIHCYNTGNYHGLVWIQGQLKYLGERLEELKDRGK